MHTHFPVASALTNNQLATPIHAYLHTNFDNKPTTKMIVMLAIKIYPHFMNYTLVAMTLKFRESRKYSSRSNATEQSCQPKNFIPTTIMKWKYLLIQHQSGKHT